MIMSWEHNQTSIYIYDQFIMTAEFYHGVDRYNVANELQPEHEGVDSMVLYTLSPDATSQFKDIKVCM